MCVCGSVMVLCLWNRLCRRKGEKIVDIIMITLFVNVEKNIKWINNKFTFHDKLIKFYYILNKNKNLSDIIIYALRREVKT